MHAARITVPSVRPFVLDESDTRHGAYDFYAEQLAAPVSGFLVPQRTRFR